ncbi:hypothetical protein PGUG_00118 [Meyerozyma guilliermondii ATCC 6260]|uniref:Major facilitator superfamily (MFS) profile domain-containing protein n=1 Tax=Meyerozyma guilliermondii (strain ATCC 6260 / CBS 566 / DSM 6381 / JCM 1539 / NBRC 10279 / NRRL Y-324) TaxID=294746 RepID=A5DA13_PICGU|nr:uncharacterized protein PGUG_00118 [Meyerozyma guilliermondii ATCC 6260]EDK36020.2 hypothetical protein PGUG_00118 [Meyerozyma guilliermondii ATCC 6260]
MSEANSMKKGTAAVEITNIDSPNLAEKLGDAHMNILPARKVIICLSALALGMIISFADQTGVTVALPHIGKELHAETTINWAGTASLLANCVCQVLFGRLSDIFGRKQIMIGCLAILVVADLCCGFAQTGVQFYIFRAFAGIGNGGVSSLSMVILSDVVTLEQRGKFQGILGANVGVGNAIGPFLMAAFVKHRSWRDFYYLLAPMGLLVIIAVYFLVEDKQKDSRLLNYKEKFQKIDYFGILFATAGLTLLLIPISGGGSTYAWNSPIVITMFVVGGVLMIVFLLIEWKVPQLPMIPLYIFKRASLSLLLGSTFFFGMAYFGFMYYVPYYFHVVKGRDIIHTSIFLLPLVLSQSIMSIVSGQIITRTGHYIYVVWAGYVMWFVSCGLLILWDDKLSDGVNVVVLLLMGSGVGFTFQPTMVAAQAQSKKADRAVVISTRNVLRSFGGAVGIAIGSTTVSNTFLNNISSIEENNVTNIPQSYFDFLRKHIYQTIDTTKLNPQQAEVVRRMYVKALKNYFYLLIPFIGICLICSLFVRDRGLQCIDEPTKEERDLGTEIEKTRYANSSHDLESTAGSNATVDSEATRTH